MGGDNLRNECRVLLKQPTERRLLFDRSKGIKDDLEMLVLSRKAGERICIGKDVTITVVRITGGGVRIGIEAPPDLAIVREELKSSQSGDNRAEKLRAEFSSPTKAND